MKKDEENQYIEDADEVDFEPPVCEPPPDFFDNMPEPFEIPDPFDDEPLPPPQKKAAVAKVEKKVEKTVQNEHFIPPQPTHEAMPAAVNIEKLLDIVRLDGQTQGKVQQIGMILNLRNTDAVWALIILAAKHVAATESVPAIIQTSVAAAVQEVVEKSSGVAAGEVRKKVLAALVERDKKVCCWSDRFTAWGIVAALVFFSFLAGNTVNQLEFCYNLAKICGIQ